VDPEGERQRLAALEAKKEEQRRINRAWNSSQSVRLQEEAKLKAVEEGERKRKIEEDKVRQKAEVEAQEQARQAAKLQAQMMHQLNMNGGLFTPQMAQQMQVAGFIMTESGIAPIGVVGQGYAAVMPGTRFNTGYSHAGYHDPYADHGGGDHGGDVYYVDDYGNHVDQYGNPLGALIGEEEEYPSSGVGDDEELVNEDLASVLEVNAFDFPELGKEKAPEKKKPVPVVAKESLSFNEPEEDDYGDGEIRANAKVFIPTFLPSSAPPVPPPAQQQQQHVAMQHTTPDMTSRMGGYDSLSPPSTSALLSQQPSEEGALQSPPTLGLPGDGGVGASLGGIWGLSEDLGSLGGFGLGGSTLGGGGSSAGLGVGALGGVGFDDDLMSRPTLSNPFGGFQSQPQPMQTQLQQQQPQSSVLLGGGGQDKGGDDDDDDEDGLLEMTGGGLWGGALTGLNDGNNGGKTSSSLSSIW
jgi:hypothetical protein